jgi:hypothetical protein
LVEAFDIGLGDPQVGILNIPDLGRRHGEHRRQDRRLILHQEDGQRDGDNHRGELGSVVPEHLKAHPIHRDPFLRGVRDPRARPMNSKNPRARARVSRWGSKVALRIRPSKAAKIRQDKTIGSVSDSMAPDFWAAWTRDASRP